MPENRYIRTALYLLTLAVTVLAVYVFLRGGDLMVKLDAFY